MTALVTAGKRLLADVLKLRNPGVAAGVAALVVSAIPGVNLDATLFAAVLVAGGTVASFVDSLFSPSPTPVPPGKVGSQGGD